MITIEIPDNKAEIKRQIEALERLLVTDDRKRKRLHKEVIKDLQEALNE